MSILIREWEAAEQELEAFLKHAKPSELKEDYPRLVAQHREAVTTARDVMYEAMNEVEAYDGMRPFEDWDKIPIADKRRMLAGLIERVSIRKSTNGRWDPIDGRVEIAWR